MLASYPSVLIRFRADPVRRCTGRPGRPAGSLGPAAVRHAEDEHIYCHGLTVPTLAVTVREGEKMDMALPRRCLRFHQQDAAGSSLYVAQ